MLKIYLPLAFVIGGLCALAMAPYDFWPVFIVGFGGLYWAVAKVDKGWKAFAVGYLFAFGYFVFGLYWIGNALLVEGNPYAWAWPLAVCGLPALLAFFNGFACYGARRFLDLSRWHGYLGFAAFLGLFEYARGHVFTGFPWSLYGYTWADTPMAQMAFLESVYGLTWLTVLWLGFGGFVFVCARRKEQIVLGVCLFLSVGTAYGYGHHRLSMPVSYHEDVQVKIVQPNTLQHEKWQKDKMLGHFENALALSNKGAEESNLSTIIVWPETTLSPKFLAPYFRAKIAKMLQSYAQGAVLLTGALRYKPAFKTYHNSLISIDTAGSIQNTYDKSHLVPFGEYIPFQDYIPLAPITQFTGFQAGDGLQIYDSVQSLKYTPLVCYEVIFPNASIPKGTAPDFIVNVTNDAWYGISPGPYQHFTKAKFRAIETGVPVIRAANTGISGVINPLGRIVGESQLFEKQMVLTKLPEKIEVAAKNQYFKYVYFPGFAILSLFMAFIFKNILRNQ